MRIALGHWSRCLSCTESCRIPSSVISTRSHLPSQICSIFCFLSTFGCYWHCVLAQPTVSTSRFSSSLGGTRLSKHRPSLCDTLFSCLLLFSRHGSRSLGSANTDSHCRTSSIAQLMRCTWCNSNTCCMTQSTLSHSWYSRWG